MKPIRFVTSLALAAVCMVPAIGQEGKLVSKGGVEYYEFPFGSVERKARWETSEIPVCWEGPSPLAEGAFRAQVRQAVEETWERNSKLRFRGWGRCTAGELGIHIRVADENPHVKTLGRYLDGRPDGMVLNFTFKNFSPACQTQVEFCNKAIAVHEFGHAIGFAHEQNRPDAPAECRAESQGTTGDWNVTEYDAYSVMNYCNPSWNGDGKLSPRDITTVQTLYGKP